MISYPHPSSSSSNYPNPPMDTPSPSTRQLQGPRPSPLKVQKSSYIITKTPPTNPNPPPRPPVIIYTVSPKIIHTDPSEFMTLVQRLTGPTSLPQETTNHQINLHEDEDENEDPNNNPPGTLLPSFFSTVPAFDAGAFGFLQDSSPNPNGGFLISPRNLLSTPTVPSPSAAWDIVFNEF